MTMAERPTEMDDFLCEPRMARIATVNTNGSAHVVPVVYIFNPEDGSFFISTGANSVTVRNLRRNSSLTICVDDDEHPFRAVIVEGEPEISEPLGTDHEGLKRIVDHNYRPGMWADWVKMPSSEKIRVRLILKPRSRKWWDQRLQINGSVRVG
jgi:nitroimidazol reductase NimA-like FMN-containing flavoprotein (pyridoxamine 5'-phosphate oxidase superfamily)